MNGIGTIGQRETQDRSQPDDVEDEEAIDPDLLQPEYDDTKKTPVNDSTEVI